VYIKIKCRIQYCLCIALYENIALENLALRIMDFCTGKTAFIRNA
jgi:hypothetical protein